jgi:cyclic-di-GMP-binding biofilm dispersal mediator protein
LAGRAIAGEPPKMPVGLDPRSVAATICDAIAGDATELPSTVFGP